MNYDQVAAEALTYARLSEIEHTLGVVSGILAKLEEALTVRDETERGAGELLADLAEIEGGLDRELQEALWSGAHALDPVNTLKRRLYKQGLDRAVQCAVDYQKGTKR